MTRAQLDVLAALANSKGIEGRPYKFFGNLHFFYCRTADNPEVLASIPNPRGVVPLTDSKTTTWMSVSVGDVAMNLQTREVFLLERYPLTEFTNWRKLLDNEFVVSPTQPVSAVGKAWYEPNGVEISNPGFTAGQRFWTQLRVFRDGVWDKYQGPLTELNRIRHNSQRALANNDPAKEVVPAWLRESEDLISTGPWVLVGGPDGAGFHALAPGNFSMAEGGLGPRKILQSLQSWPAGHQVSDIQVWWSDEVATDVRPTFRIEPEWSYQRNTTDYGPYGDISGFRYEGQVAGGFNAWMYVNAAVSGDPTIWRCSHPGFLKETKARVRVVTNPYGTFHDWRDVGVIGVRIEGSLNPGETFWVQPRGHVDQFGRQLPVQTVGTDGGTGGLNAESVRARLIPARHPEIDSNFFGGPRASEGEVFGINVSPNALSNENTGVLHGSRNFRTALFSWIAASTWELPDADFRYQRTVHREGQLGLVECGFVGRYRNAEAEIPELVAFAGRTIPPFRMMSIGAGETPGGAGEYQRRFAPLAKLASPQGAFVSDPEGMLDPVSTADQSLFYPYPCIRQDRPQTGVTLPSPYTGWSARSPSGMVCRIDVRRTPVSVGGGVLGYPTSAQAPLLVRVGCMINGNFNVYSTIVVAADENYKTTRVAYPTWGAPVAYDCAQDPDILVTALFVPVVQVSRQAHEFVYANRYVSTDGHKWIASPLLADEHNGLTALLGKL